MMMIGRQILTAFLSAAIGLSPVAHATNRAYNLTMNQVIQSESVEYLRYLDQQKYGRNPQELARKTSKFKTITKATGHAIFSDVIQMSMIMAASAAAELYKQRKFQERLLGTYKPKVEEVQAGMVEAAQDVICGAKNKEPSVSEEIGCSGEFWVGTAGGFALRLGMSGVAPLLKLLTKGKGTHSALISSVGTFATSFFMIAGFTASGQLWTQAVHVLGDKEKEEKAHNLFGRWVIEMASGNLEKYLKTEDGQLASQVWENMKNILLYDANLRNSWMYNAWRFGFARGEIVLNLGILMASLEGGAVIGAAGGGAFATWLAGLLGLGTLATSAVALFSAAVIATAFGAGIAALMVYAPDLGVGERITKVIQSTRAFMATTNHSLTRAHFTVATDAFDVNRFDSPVTNKYRKRYENRAKYLFDELRKQRLNLMNIYLEKYYELREEIQKAEANLAVAKEVLKNTDLRKTMVVKGEDDYMTYDEAWAASCATPGRYDYCVVPAADQLRVIDQSKHVIAEGRKLLEEIAESMITIYDQDSDFLQTRMDQRNLHFQPDMAIAIKDEATNLGLIAEKLTFFFGALHSRIAEKYQLDFTGEKEKDISKAFAIDFVTKRYVPGMDEDIFLGDLKIVNGKNR